MNAALYLIFTVLTITPSQVIPISDNQTPQAIVYDGTKVTLVTTSPQEHPIIRPRQVIMIVDAAPVTTSSAATYTYLGSFPYQGHILTYFLVVYPGPLKAQPVPIEKE